MQISKTFLACGVTVLGLATCSAQATDTPADAQLREAVRQKIAETSTATAPGTPVMEAAPATAVPAQAQVEQVAPVVIEAPVAAAVAAPTVVVQPQVAPVPTVEDDAQTAQLREALRQRMSELPAGSSTATATPAATMVLEGNDQQPVVATTTVSTSPAEVKSATSEPVPMAAPASPLPASKEERLAVLLQQYKADQISPQQYHVERAKILAE